MPLIRRASLLFLVAVLSVSARAGVVSPAGPVFAPPAGAWAGPLGAVFSDPAASPFLPASFATLSLTSPEALRMTAPLVHSLAQNLAITPQALVAMDPDQRKAAVELAVEDAREAVRVKAYELAQTARVLSKPGRAMDEEGRAELYDAVAKLMEMRQYYGPWLDDDTKTAVEDGYKTLSLRAWEVRTFLLERDYPAAQSRRERALAPAPPAALAYVLRPTGSAAKLRADMEHNKSGWGQSDLDTLYAGYGFVLRQGGKHRFYSHPGFAQLHESVSRQNDLPPGYAQSALKLIAELERLVAAQHTAAAAPATGPPVTLSLDDLSILLSQPKPRVETPKPVVENVRARAPLAPSLTRVAQLQPATPKAVAVKAEPPPVITPPAKTGGLIERIKVAWGTLTR